jgi:hypothetical protein
MIPYRVLTSVYAHYECCECAQVFVGYLDYFDRCEDPIEHASGAKPPARP